MNTIIKQVLAFILSFALIFSSTSALAASPSGWSVSPADIIMGAAGNTVTAIKGAGSSALQSTVRYAPTAANIGKNILKGGGAVAVGYAVYQIAGKSVDWVLDPANNSVKYKETVTVSNTVSLTKYCVARHAQTGDGWGNGAIVGEMYNYNPDAFQCRTGNRIWLKQLCDGGMCGESVEEFERSIPISTVAAKVQSNAAAGHAPSQELIKTIIIDDVNAGALDVPLNTAAVPKADAPPVADPNNPPWYTYEISVHT